MPRASPRSQAFNNRSLLRTCDASPVWADATAAGKKRRRDADAGDDRGGRDSDRLVTPSPPAGTFQLKLDFADVDDYADDSDDELDPHRAFLNVLWPAPRAARAPPRLPPI